MPRRKGLDSTLKVLAALLEVGGELNISALARVAGLRFDTAERAITVLKDAGFVEEEVISARGGAIMRIIKLTEKGRKAAEHARAILELAGEKVHE